MISFLSASPRIHKALECSYNVLEFLTLKPCVILYFVLIKSVILIILFSLCFVESLEKQASEGLAAAQAMLSEDATEKPSKSTEDDDEGNRP